MGTKTALKIESFAFFYNSRLSIFKPVFVPILTYGHVARDNAPYFLLPGPNHLPLKFNSKMQYVKRVLDLNCKQKED